MSPQRVCYTSANEPCLEVPRDDTEREREEDEVRAATVGKEASAASYLHSSSLPSQNSRRRLSHRPSRSQLFPSHLSVGVGFSSHFCSSRLRSKIYFRSVHLSILFRVYRVNFVYRSRSFSCIASDSCLRSFRS